VLQLHSFESTTAFGISSVVVCLTALTALVATTIIIATKVLTVPSEVLESEAYRKLYGTFYSAYTTNRVITKGWYLVFMLRRTLFVLILVFYHDYPTLQISAIVVITVVYVMALTIIRPYRAKWTGNIINIIAEFVILISL
jgi:hypothetical protein